MEHNGHVHSDAGLVDLDLRFPSSWAARVRGASNREQRFAAGYAACYRSALELIA